MSNTTSEPIQIPVNEPVKPSTEVEKVKEDRSLPKPPGSKPTLEEFQVWGNALKPEAYNRLSIYTYRLIPVLNRKLFNPDAVGYIDVLTKEAFDEGLREYFIRVHGGGKYKLLVNDLEKYRVGNSTTIMTCIFNIPQDEKLPIINFKELDINAKENLGYLNVLRQQGIFIDPKGNVVTPTQGINNSGSDPSALASTLGQMFKEFTSIYDKLNTQQQATIKQLVGDGTGKKDGITEIMLERMKQDDPNKQVNTMIALITAMREMNKGSDSGNKDQLSLVVELMNKSHEAQMQTMNKMIEMVSNQSAARNKEPQESFFDSLLKFASLKEKLPGLFGNSEPSQPKQTAEIILDGVKEFALPAIGLASQFLQLRGAQPIVPVTPQQAHEFINRSQPMNQQPQSRVITMPQSQPNPNPTSATSAAATNDPATLEPIPGALPLDPNNPTLCQQFIYQYGGMLSTGINNPNLDGYGLAESLVSMGSLMGKNYYALLKNEGKEQIIGSMKSFPQFWNATGKVLGEDRISQLIDEFLDYADLPIDDDDDDEDNPNDGNDNGNGEKPKGVGA